MTLQIGIVFPLETDRKWITDLQRQINGLRKDQVIYCERLLRSWRVFRSYYPRHLINKAIKRTLRDRP